MITNTSAININNPREIEHHDTLSIQLLGFWVYLMSDLILFSTFFATYIVFSHSFAQGPTGKQLFNLPYVLGETMFLLLSSVVYGTVMYAVQKGKKKLVLIGLTITFILGLCFVGMEVNEFYKMILEGHGPGVSAFLSSFFALVGTHGTHVFFGLIWITVMLLQVALRGLDSYVQSRLIRLGMFWHFLDVVWIGIFSIVYLMGVM